MPNLARYPRGLLDLMSFNSAGENVREVSNQLVEVVDIRDHLLSDVLIGVAGIRTTPAAGNNVPNSGGSAGLITTVPQGEVWALYSIAASCSLEAGVTADVSATITVNGQYRCVVSNAVDAAAGETRWSTAVFPRPILLPSGTQLGAYLSNLTGAPTAASSIEVNGLIARLRG